MKTIKPKKYDRCFIAESEKSYVYDGEEWIEDTGGTSQKTVKKSGHQPLGSGPINKRK